jgi:hypothetical protein
MITTLFVSLIDTLFFLDGIPGSGARRVVGTVIERVAERPVVGAI